MHRTAPLMSIHYYNRTPKPCLHIIFLAPSMRWERFNHSQKLFKQSYGNNVIKSGWRTSWHPTTSSCYHVRSPRYCFPTPQCNRRQSQQNWSHVGPRESKMIWSFCCLGCVSSPRLGHRPNPSTLPLDLFYFKAIMIRVFYCTTISRPND